MKQPSHYMQSDAFAVYLAYLGWDTVEVGSGKNKQFLFERKMPLLGRIAKMPKANWPLPFDEISNLINRDHLQLCRIEPNIILPTSEVEQQQLSDQFRQYNFYPSWPDCELQTILVDLTPDSIALLQSFPRENTRRNIRFAQKSKLIAEESNDVEVFYRLHKDVAKRRKFYCPPLAEIKTFYDAFAKRKQATICLVRNGSGDPIAGVLLVFYQNVAYYRYVGATEAAENLRAPSLAVWQSLLIAKEHDCTTFDFGGVADERQPNKRWQGYSHFKAGFSSNHVRYVAPFAYYGWPVGKMMRGLDFLQRR